MAVLYAIEADSVREGGGTQMNADGFDFADAISVSSPFYCWLRLDGLYNPALFTPNIPAS